MCLYIEYIVVPINVKIAKIKKINVVNIKVDSFIAGYFSNAEYARMIRINKFTITLMVITLLGFKVFFLISTSFSIMYT